MASDKDIIKLWRDRADELRRKCDEQYAELKRWRNWAAQYGDRVGVAENATTIAYVVRNILGFVEEAMKLTENMYILTCLNQIAKWAKSLTVAVSKTETTTPLLPKDGENVNKQTAVDTGVNNAKMREALESISSILKGFDFDNQNAPTPDDLNCVHSAIDIADAALAAPPRNCDKYPTFNAAIRVLADKRGWHDAKWDSERYCILASWLYAPYTEGDNNADK